MCGVVGIVYGELNKQLGIESSALLKKLEYRGYDSTGGVFFEPDGKVTLKKKVGAPSKVVRQLEMERNRGHKFIGQVRWATYGAVTDVNAQPHEMSCLHHIVGAHNGNISNTDNLKEFLADHGHNVRSDNDGEMLVHEVEHYYDNIVRRSPPKDEAARIRATIQAIRRAERKVEGSYAACVAFPDLPGIFAIKSGSSLYAGKGSDANGDFIVVSSDLTSVLSKTRFLIPLAEGEGLYFTHDDYKVFSLAGHTEHKPRLRRSRLNVADISLQSRYRYFMHQEIYTASENVERILQYYFAEEHEKALFAVFEKDRKRCKEIIFELLKLYDIFDTAGLAKSLQTLLARKDFKALMKDAEAAGVSWPAAHRHQAYRSDEAQLLTELFELDRSLYKPLWLLDEVVIWKKKRKVTYFRDELSSLIKKSGESGGRVFAIGAGTSHNASLVGAYLFNNIANLAILPVNPGMFRSMYINALTEHDVLIGVTQSGETKDLLDIYNDVRVTYGNKVRLISLVNNELSTIPQEKSDFFLPILCGPEIAVAATKSFISQVTLFHLLACMNVMKPEQVQTQISRVRTVIDFTLRAVEDDISEVALKLFLKPSMHILGTSMIGLAKEGALKIREVVLNHTEGYDSAEFKHGPNTILGKNTIFSLTEMQHLLEDAFEFFGEMCARKFSDDDEDTELLETQLAMLKDVGFSELALEAKPGQTGEFWSVQQTYESYKGKIDLENYFSNYPLIFFCPPDERDRKITITQIHTHKIRGADVILIARDDDDLRRSVEGKPAEVHDYYAKYIRVPKMYGKNMFVYQASVVLQLLAFKMSLDKMKYLNRHHVENHGVHPDVPKNVSKSITVD